jgi:hypothetical protein
MKAEEMRVKIAEAVGYRLTKVWRYGPDGKRQDYWEHPSGLIHRRTTWLPCYHNCLNALHSAEFALLKSGSDWSRYYAELSRECADEKYGSDEERNSPFSATAPQRCEALIRALKL